MKMHFILTKLYSRKLLAWIIATILLWNNKIDGQEWMFITIIYLIAQGTVDVKTVIQAYTNIKTKTNDSINI